MLIDVWTYTCVNCIRTFPYLKSWHSKYAAKGLVIIGVHSPEFDFEKDRENVVNAVNEFGLEYPIAIDNDHETWSILNNLYWPSKYLIDKGGYIRYTHFGEGAYAETEAKIRELLVETGADLSGISEALQPEPELDASARASDFAVGLTRELYAGFVRNFYALLQRANPPYILHREYYDSPETDTFYTDPGDHQNHFIYLQGQWRNEQERLVHSRATESFEDYVAVRFYARTVNSVMAPADSQAFKVLLTIDGRPLTSDEAGVDVDFEPDGRSYVLVAQPRMYRLVSLASFGGHELRLSSNSIEFALYAFTFGAYYDEPIP